MMLKGWGIPAAVALLLGVAAACPPSRSAYADPPDPGGGWAHAGLAPGAAPGRTAKAAGGGPRTESIAGFPVAGIDISSHDHPNGRAIDWAGVAASGVKFVYVKAVEGNFYTNPYFAGDYQAARDSGGYAGAYDFGRPDLGDPVGQADYFADNMLWTGDNRNLVPFLDMEWPYSSLHLPACWNLGPTQMTAWIRSFLGEVQRRIGRRPMIYTNTYWWNPCTGNDATFGDYPLDLASYTSTPPTHLPAGWSTFTLWQYAGGDPGVAGDFDSDVYNGDLTGLATLAGSTPPTVVSLLSHADGRFVTAEAAGTRPLIANRPAIGTWEQFDEVPAGDGYVALRSHANGRYVTAEAGGAGALVANRTALGAWEKFQLVPNGDGSVGLRAAANGRYVTAERAGAAPLIANRTGVGQWESFDVVAPPTVVTLRARSNGGYVSADRGGAAPLVANRTTVGPWEQFDRIDLGGGYVALRAHAGGRWVSADRAGTAPLIANRTALGSWERFQLLDNADGSVSLRAAVNGRYVTSNDGYFPLVADRAAAGAWEEFDLG